MFRSRLVRRAYWDLRVLSRLDLRGRRGVVRSAERLRRTPGLLQRRTVTLELKKEDRCRFCGHALRFRRFEKFGERGTVNFFCEAVRAVVLRGFGCCDCRRCGAAVAVLATGGATPTRAAPTSADAPDAPDTPLRYDDSSGMADARTGGRPARGALAARGRGTAAPDACATAAAPPLLP